MFRERDPRRGKSIGNYNHEDIGSWVTDYDKSSYRILSRAGKNLLKDWCVFERFTEPLLGFTNTYLSYLRHPPIAHMNFDLYASSGSHYTRLSQASGLVRLFMIFW